MSDLQSENGCVLEIDVTWDGTGFVQLVLSLHTRLVDVIEVIQCVRKIMVHFLRHFFRLL